MGRKQNPSNQGFSQWCKEMGFDDIHRNTRADAMWFASLQGHRATPVDLTHPQNIRKWFNDQPKEALPADLDAAELTKTTSAAMWLASNWSELQHGDAAAESGFQPLETSITHPTFAPCVSTSMVENTR